MLSADDSNPNDSSPETNHRKTLLVHLQRFARAPSPLTFERWFFILLHCLFYVIFFTIIYIRFEHFNRKQELFLNLLHQNSNQTIPRTENPSVHSSVPNPIPFSPSQLSENCSCTTLIPPRRNRTTRCIQLRVGSEKIENVFCPINGRSNRRLWLKIQQRESNAVSFNRSWNEYRRGFGHVLKQTDFWIGNENLHWLTDIYQCRLKIELTDWYNETRTAIYETFSVANHVDGYRIHLDNYHGDMEAANKVDAFSRHHNNARFSTYDHYATTRKCPEMFAGAGWWYHSASECAHVQLNGQIATHSDGLVPLNTGLLWIGWRSDRHYSFQRVTMSIQPRSRHLRRRSSN